MGDANTVKKCEDSEIEPATNTTEPIEPAEPIAPADNTTEPIVDHMAVDGYKFCSKEYKFCKCNGIIRYGNPLKPGKFAENKNGRTGFSLHCGNSIFGEDPAPNVLKACYCKLDKP